ncbi:MAG TPA: RcnB family protein [Rhizomicrobium sp.]
MMKKSLLATAVSAALGSAGVAFAQDQTTTTVTQTPDETTQTTVSKSHDADGGYTEYRKTITSSKHFAIGPWTPPPDYTVHHIVLGDKLPADLMAENYYLDSYQTYSLVAPPEGTVWVRVGSDAFLVRRDDGEVIQADYGLFG